MAQRGILKSSGPASFRYGRVAEPQLGFYFLPFFLFSGLYLSFQILRDLVSTFPDKKWVPKAEAMPKTSGLLFHVASSTWAPRNCAGRRRANMVAGNENKAAGWAEAEKI